MKNKFTLVLLLFFSPVLFAGEKKVIGVVFHSSYCEVIPEAQKSYISTVKNKGYTVVDLCASSRSTSELKADIRSEAELRRIKWEDVEGINIIGPVVNTLLHPSLSRYPMALVPSVDELVFDDLNFSYAASGYLSDVNSYYWMPSRVRWVSQFPVKGKTWDQVVNELSKAEKQMAFVDEDNCGRRFSNDLLEGLNLRRAWLFDDWSSFPDGIAYNVGTYIFSFAAWNLMGWSREREGYSRVNRLETPTDKFMYIFIIYPSLVALNSIATYKLGNHIFSRSLPNDDLNWKKYILNTKLTIDGLTRQGFCAGKNKAP